MAGLYTGATGLWGGFAGLLYGSTSLSTPPGLLADVGASFSPASLFAAGEPGVWYDPSDFSTMFQDSAGITPVTAVEQPVGLLLDKSQGLVLGPEIFSSFTSTGLWTVSGSTYSISSAASNTDLRVDFIGTVGKRYVISFTASGVSGSLIFYPLTSTPAASIVNGTNVTRVLANTGGFIIRAVTGASATVSNISVKELPGNHATQATSASRPVLSARVNLLLATAALSTQSVTTAAATYTLSFTGAGTVTLSGTATGTYSAGTNSFVCTAGTLTLTVVGSVTTADLRVTNDGVGLPAYQAVVTSTDYDTTGFPYYLRFDGSDDSMATNTITPGIDKAQVFAGVRKLSDAAQAVVAEMSATIASNNGTFLLAAPDDASATFAFDSKGTTQVDAIASSLTAPLTRVVTGIGDISGDTAIIRINGVQADQETSDQGTGNYLAYPLYIGRRNNATLPLNGRIYSLITRFGANLDVVTINNTEVYVSGKMGGGYVSPITGYDFLVDANGDQITDASDNPLFTQVLYT
jgi:hypothetical protein